ncbi:hypothetical protein [Prescottella agglutinans]|uniref:Uncharacterized protein n=1 Tax=Prescottella agglutinans TaxID=1644129 RepID=A0ABT6MJD7_9NOCA|nr:hypothetical protein [Prescottella agglutinans]MDH6284015.1 hypothetical protein [Prescottella agglutinans]
MATAEVSTDDTQKPGPRAGQRETAGEKRTTGNRRRPEATTPPRKPRRLVDGSTLPCTYTVVDWAMLPAETAAKARRLAHRESRRAEGPSARNWPTPTTVDALAVAAAAVAVAVVGIEPIRAMLSDLTSGRIGQDGEYYGIQVAAMAVGVAIVIALALTAVWVRIRTRGERLRRSERRALASATRELTWPASPVGAQRRLVEQVLAAELAVEKIQANPGWSSTYGDEQRVRLNLDEELEQIAVSAHKLIEIHDATPTEPVADRSIPASAARERWAERRRVLADAEQAISRRVAALSDVAASLPGPTMVRTNLQMERESARVDGEIPVVEAITTASLGRVQHILGVAGSIAAWAGADRASVPGAVGDAETAGQPPAAVVGRPTG